jgi:enamine deaminase RidA (YjgF/YER057c/UK114 family)
MRVHARRDFRSLKISGTDGMCARFRTVSFQRYNQRRGVFDMSKLEHLRPEGLQQNPTYSHVVVASGKRMIFTAGQVSVDERGALVGAGDLAAQTTQVLRNLGLALAAAGASYADVTKITTYVVNYKPEHRAIIGKARSAFFANGAPPASTLVGVTSLALPEWLIEIEATAVVD